MIEIKSKKSTLDFVCQRFEELTNAQVYQISAARMAVFIVEQDCVYQDLDGIDLEVWHLQGFQDNKLACYARIIPPNIHQTGKPAIGRVLTAQAFRGHGYGRELMLKAIELCQQYYPQQTIYISAQSHLIDFYQSLGFVAQGSSYLEDNIPHIDMLLEWSKVNAQ